MGEGARAREIIMLGWTGLAILCAATLLWVRGVRAEETPGTPADTSAAALADTSAAALSGVDTTGAQGAATPDSVAMTPTAATAAAAAAAAAAAGNPAAPETTETGGFHPGYQVRYNIEKDVRSLSHSIRADYALGEKLHFSTSSALNEKDETTLQRDAEQRTVATSLEYRLSPDAALGVDFSSNWSLDSDKRPAVPIDNKSTARNLGLFTRFEHRLADSLLFKFNASAGSENTELRDVEESGTKANIGVDVEYRPWTPLQTQFSWKGARSTNDARSISGVTENRDVAQTMNGSVVFRPTEPLKFQLGLAAENKQFQFPDLADTTRPQDTRVEDKNGITFSGDYQHSKDLTMKFEVSRNHSSKDYRLHPDRTGELISREVKTTFNYSAWEGGKTTLAMGRDQSEEEFPHPQSRRSDQTKKVEHGGMTLSHDQVFSSRLKSTLSGKVDLLSYAFAQDSAQVNDRDLLTQSLEWTGDYRFSSKLLTNFVLGVKEDQTVNIASARSGENNTKQSWWIRPRVRVEPSENVKVTQTYELRSDFTFFDQNKSQNFLSKKSQVDTQFFYRVTKGVSIDLGHMYQVRDEGAFDRERDEFAKATQSSKQSLDVSTGYSPFTGFRISFGERIEANRNYEYKDADADGVIDKIRKPGIQGSSVRSQFVLGLNFTWPITKKWNLILNGRQTVTRGTQVSDLEKRYYQADITMDYTL